MRNQATDNRVEARKRTDEFARERGTRERSTRPTYGGPETVARLNGALQNLAKAADTPATIAAGTPMVAPAREMREQGRTGDFAQAMKENPKFPKDIAGRLIEFGNLFEGGGPGPEQPRRRSSIA